MIKTRFLAGCVTLAAVCALQAAYAPGLSTMETSKPWSVSASFRGFYDDNYTTASGDAARDSFGLAVSPSVSLHVPLDQTLFSLNYIYDIKYYEDRLDNEYDQSHRVSGKMEHAFTDRFKISIEDSFVASKEPEFLNPTGVGTYWLKTDQSNIRNSGSIHVLAQMTPLLGLQLGYANTFYDYEQTGISSLSALLDRTEHLISANLRWQAFRQTVAILGYNYGMVRYTSDDPFITAVIWPFIFTAPSSIRDYNSHYAYIGADHSFSSQLTGSIRVGGQFSDYYNYNTDSVSPYADVSLAYTYAPGSVFQGGLRHQRASTYLTALDQEATAVYGMLTHAFGSRLSGTLYGQYQHSIYNGGWVDGETEDYFMMSASVSYRINTHLSAEAGYNFDRVDSPVGLAYSRNRVYLGVRATY